MKDISRRGCPPEDPGRGPGRPRRRGDRPGGHGRQRAGPVPARLRGLMRPVGGRDPARRHGPDRQVLSRLQASGRGLPARRAPGGGPGPGLTLTEHFVLAEEPQGFFIDRDNGRKTAPRSASTTFNIRGTPASTVEVAFGRQPAAGAAGAAARRRSTLLLLEHPTRGLDIESAIYIWSKLKERCRPGHGDHLHLVRPGGDPAIQRPRPGLLQPARSPRRWMPATTTRGRTRRS
ncbi:MAG: hypothetical protein M0C28_17355 [Candidatus Moduliflexus flocculans]|nr:hypothetical protein [Candidatus Moduliflexus flocculans]